MAAGFKAFVPTGRLWVFSFFLVIILGGTVALLLPGMWLGDEPLSILSALFTATSAVCVTGLIVVDTAQFSLAGQTVIMILIQIGGLGIMTLVMLFVLGAKGPVSLRHRRLLGDYFLPSVEFRPHKVVAKVLLYALVVELAVWVFLWIAFAGHGVADSWFVALFHSISAFCNAGFSTFANGLQGFVGMPAVSWPIVLAVIVGGIGFVVQDDVRKRLVGTVRHVSLHTKVVIVATALLLLLSTTVFAILEWNGALVAAGDGFFAKLWEALVMSVMPRTAGFDTIAPATQGDAASIFTTMLMVIGGAPASTAGGLKITTFAILLLATLRGIDADADMSLGRRRAPAALIGQAAMLMVRMAILVGILLILLTWTEHLSGGSKASIGDLLFEIVSAFSTVGLSRGVTSQLSPGGQVLVILAMYLGRIGLLALALPRSKRNELRAYSLPDEEILIG